MNKVNKSFLYLFPILYQELIEELALDYKIFHTNNWLVTVKNTYCYTETPYQYVIKFIISDESNNILELFKKSSIFAAFSITDTLNIIINIPENCLHSYNQFITGKYSRFSEKDKQSILKFVDNFLAPGNSKESNEVKSTVKDVLYKGKERIKVLIEKFGLREDEWSPEWELSSKISVDEETFN